MLLLFFASIGVLGYIYVGYPLVLQLIVWLRGERPVRRGTDLPSISFVISAHNEAAVIRAKLENALALDYPAALLQIAVISDASSDATDEIVKEFSPRVDLLRQPERRGKTAGLNRFVPQLRGDIVIFSDANAMYERDSLRMLVRNFADPEVGCVTGEARYLKSDQSAAAISERVYWDYEIWIKQLESAASSMVGGDGAIYAIRRPLWRELPEDAINDFLNPLQIVAGGYRGVYEPAAVCYEETAGAVPREWRRRIRIVSRSWRAVFQAPGALDPFRVGLFAFCLFSHKILRWLSAAFMVVAGTALAFVMPEVHLDGRVVAGVAFALAVGAALFRPVRRPFAFVFYFLAINLASLVGVIRGATGRVSGVWTTPRGETERAHIVRIGVPILVSGLLLLATMLAGLVVGSDRSAVVVFWVASGIVFYVYGAYPALLRLLPRAARHQVFKSAIEPRVCLLIAANDEAEVIGQKLENSLRLDYPAHRLEIVVASDGSRDLTNEIVASFAPRGVRLIAFDRRRGKMAAINDAMTSIDAEIVVLSDANTFLRADALRMLVRNFADEHVGAVSGDVVLTGERAALAGSEDMYYRYERALQRLESNIGSLIGVDGALYALRRRLFVAPPADTILDDMAIPMEVIRAGYRVIFEEQALAAEAGSMSSSEEFSRKSRVVAGAVQFLCRGDSSVPARNIQVLFALVSHKALRWMSPAFAAIAFVASVRLATSSPFFSGALIGELVIVGAGILGCFPALRRIGPIAAAHYLCLVQAAAAFGFVKGVSGRQAAAWRRFARARIQPT